MKKEFLLILGALLLAGPCVAQTVEQAKGEAFTLPALQEAKIRTQNMPAMSGVVVVSNKSVASAQAPLIEACDSECYRELSLLEIHRPNIEAWSCEYRFAGIDGVLDVAKETRYVLVKLRALELLGETIRSLNPDVVHASLDALGRIGISNHNEGLDFKTIKILEDPAQSLMGNELDNAISMIREIAMDSHSRKVKELAVQVLAEAKGTLPPVKNEAIEQVIVGIKASMPS